MTTETRTFAGETGTGIFDGYAGFRIGQAYQLHLERRADGQVAIELPHGAPGTGPLVVTTAQFEKWFRLG